MKEYRIVGKYGMWGEIHSDIEDARKDLDFCRQEYEDRDEFHLEERDVTKWSIHV